MIKQAQVLNALKIYKRWDRNNKARGVVIYIVEYVKALPDSKSKRDALLCWEAYRQASTGDTFLKWLKNKLNEEVE